MKQFVISPAPHIHSNDSVRKDMQLVLLALMPAWIVSIIAFGWGAIITTIISVVACVGCEWLITKFLFKREATLYDFSALLTGFLLALNLPSNLPWWIVVIGAIVAIGVGKMTFGGLGQNIFNPALTGRIFLLISFPAQMTTWPVPDGFATGYVDATTGATPLSVMKEMFKGGTVQMPDLWDLITGFVGGSFGETSAIALLIGGIFLICTKVITWHIPVSILGTASLFALITGWTGVLPAECTSLDYVALTLCSGGMLLGAFFMATDYVTSPMTPLGKIIFGVGIGLIVMVIRTWGAYPEGMSFAIFLMNACTPLLNKLRPKRFGERK